MAGVPGVVAAAVLLTFRRSPAVGALSGRCLCVSMFCSLAGRGFKCYELTRLVNRLKHSGCAKKQDQSRGYELTNVGNVILSQKIWRAGPDVDRKIELDPKRRSNSIRARTRRVSAGKLGRKNSAVRNCTRVRILSQKDAQLLSRVY